MKKRIIAIVSTVLVVALGAVGLVACNKGKFDINKNITVVAREDGSGTKGSFMDILGLKGVGDPKGVIIAASTASVMGEVKGNPQAIAYDSLGFVTDDVKKLTLDSVAPTSENIKNGTYKLQRPLSIIYKEATVASGLNKAFFDFLKSKQAQAIVKDGYTSMYDDAVDYVTVAGLGGAIGVSGSTSLQPLMIKLAAKFEELQNGVTVHISGGGSGTGYQDAEKGVSEFGMISEEFSGTKAPSCTMFNVAKDGIAVIVNKTNTINNITLADLKNIYNKNEAAASKITTWANVGK